MLTPFFATAMRSPGRQASFRRVVALHVVAVATLAYVATRGGLTAAGHLALILGLVEGAALIGWRLTQLPKSRALEFLLLSPVQPRRVFLAEALAGGCRFALVCLAGLPVLLALVLAGAAEPSDLWPLLAMPFAGGLVAGLGLTAWSYEPPAVRRVGEAVGLAGVFAYLVVGILAGEHLGLWLAKLPPGAAAWARGAVAAGRGANPFGLVHDWFSDGRDGPRVWRQFCELHLTALAVGLALAARAAGRLKGHFRDRHYRPLTAARAAATEAVGDRPLSWWAVRRVAEYSGRVNVWLAGGFTALYAAYLTAGDAWPPWVGRLVFQLVDGWGGAPAVAAALCVLAAVPAAFQYGLWDPTVPDRCRRLELLLLTDLDARDYMHAAAAAAWRRGRGYLLFAAVLWAAVAAAGRAAWFEVLAAAAGGLLLWGFSFAVGFRMFCTGRDASGVASGLTLGLPLLLAGLLRAGWDVAAAFVPTAACYLPLRGGVTAAWDAGAAATLAATVLLLRRGLARGDAELRAWYDANQGRKAG